MCPSSPPFTSRAGRHATPVLKLRRAFRNIMLIGLLHAGFSELQGAVTIVSLLDEPSYQNVTQSGDGSVTLALPEIPVGGIIVQPEFFIGITTGTFVQEKAVRLLITETVHGAQTEAGQLRAAAFEPDDLIDESAAWSTSTDSGVSLSRYTDVMGETEITGAWSDESIHYLGFRLDDAADAYYGYISARVTNIETAPSLSIQGFGYETSPSTGIPVTAIPEPRTVAAFAGVMVFALAGIRRWRHGIRSGRS